MKKLYGVVLSIALIMATSVCAMAGTFDEYWDFKQADGTYAYGFPRVKVSMDKNWYQKTRVVLGEGNATVSIYHTKSYNAYTAEGLLGGLLFTIGASVNTDFQDLPHFVYLGFDDEEMMNYYVSLPTDYQAYMGDESIRHEYDELWNGVEDVIANIEIKGTGKSTQSDSPVRGLSGGWEVTEDSSVTEEAQAVFDQAMPNHDRVVYDAVALLATQVVAGRNYCFLRRTSVRDSVQEPSYQLAYIWQDPQGDVHVLEVKEIEFGLS